MPLIDIALIVIAGVGFGGDAAALILKRHGIGASSNAPIVTRNRAITGRSSLSTTTTATSINSFSSHEISHLLLRHPEGTAHCAALGWVFVMVGAGGAVPFVDCHCLVDV